MSGLAASRLISRAQNYAASNAGVLWIFTATIFLSALLLFSVQPVFAKMVLPKLGGSPSVWAVSMCFFQAVLLAGYCYAHALNKFAAPKIAPLIHLGVLAVAYLALPFGLPANAEPPPGDAYLWLIGVLFLGVGLPFFAVSANAPLLQSWFARSGHPHAADPYFLYGASNLGSLLALLAYPVVIEPMLGLSMQAGVWTGGFVLLALMISGSALAMLVAARANGVAWSSNAEMIDVGTSSVTARDRAWWIWLSFVPSGLLVAFTSHLTTDVASAPFLWVLPLAVFLATFILVFKDNPVVPHWVLLMVQPVVVGLTLIGVAFPGCALGTLSLSAGGIAFLVTTLVAHRELYLARPSARHLTEFYLWMSLGGVLGGIFAALVAPQLFTTVLEYPILLLAGLACRRGLMAPMSEQDQKIATGIVAVLGLLMLIALQSQTGGIAWTPILYIVGMVVPLVLVAMIAVLWRHQGLQIAGVAVLAAVLLAIPPQLTSRHVERSFFGVHRVHETANGDFRFLSHGTTLHGARRLISETGVAVAEPIPATYYQADGPMASGVGMLRSLRGASDAGLKVGIVGLGAGSLACFADAKDTWRFYEIDPAVVRIASNPKHFDFLSKCQPNAAMILGDARLTLAKEPVAAFDYLVIDAFASDAVPVHLLTVESMRMYLDRIKPDGLLALHVTNRHLDLFAVAAATAKAVPGTHVSFTKSRPKVAVVVDAAPSNVIFVSRSKAVIDATLARPDTVLVPAGSVAPWTDDFSDVISALWRKRD